MISLETAEKLLFDAVEPFATAEVPLSAIGSTIRASEIIAQDLIADRCYPPFDRVAMDGIGLRWQSWEAGQRRFPIEGCQKAGEAQKQLLNPKSCYEVMTGASLPEACDTVIRYEDLQINHGEAVVSENVQPMLGANVHQQGADFSAGQLMLKRGACFAAPEWSLAASLGYEQVKLRQRPRISVISTGDELVEVSQTPQTHQIRISNSHAILAALAAQGFCHNQRHHFSDSREQILQGIEQQLNANDIIILSGGVSMGKFDFIPSCLADLGVTCLFHKVRQRPGKPLWVGKSKKGQLVFGLPGNPVSALVCLHRYVLPALWKGLGRMPEATRNRPHALLQSKVNFTKALTYFVPVKVKQNNLGQSLATPVPFNGSGDFSALVRCDGFLELAADQSVFDSNSAWPLYLWRGISSEI